MNWIPVPSCSCSHVLATSPSLLVYQCHTRHILDSLHLHICILNPGIVHCFPAVCAGPVLDLNRSWPKRMWVCTAVWQKKKSTKCHCCVDTVCTVCTNKCLVTELPVILWCHCNNVVASVYKVVGTLHNCNNWIVHSNTISRIKSSYCLLVRTVTYSTQRAESRKSRRNKEIQVQPPMVWWLLRGLSGTSSSDRVLEKRWITCFDVNV